MPTEQLGYYSIGSILPHIKGKRRRINLFANGEHHCVRIGSSTLRLFKRKGINCLACDVEGVYFVLERHIRRKNGKPCEPHLTLYGCNKTGEVVLMTKDHIKPASKGGSTKLKNLQPMCTICNVQKGDRTRRYKLPS